MDETLEKMKIQLKLCGYIPEVFENRESLRSSVCTLARGKSLGFGSSLTVGELGVKDWVRPLATVLFEHEPGGHGDSERNAQHADLFITSANALSRRGEIVNIDGTGNRVGATCFGPENLLYIIGKNKITPDLISAMARAKETAAKIARKFGFDTPCARTGVCSNCLSPQSVCSVTTIHRKKPRGMTVYIYLINEELGL